MSKKPELKKCPFCGNEPDICKKLNLHSQMDDFMVGCALCDALGPSADTEWKAVTLWNTRHKEKSNG